MAITTCVFDAYGTLFDVAAAARQAASEPGFEALQDKWPDLASHWRLKQLQYTWLRAVADAHTDFWDVTQDGLDWALEASGLQGDEKLRQRLLDLYWELRAYPEVPDMLKALKDGGLQTAILSNGSPPMLDGAVQSAGIGDVLDDVLSVESVGVFKPHARVYDLVQDRFGAPVTRFSSSARTGGTPPAQADMALSPHGSIGPASQWTACPGRLHMCYPI